MPYYVYDEPISKARITELLGHLQSVDSPRGVLIHSPGGPFTFFPELASAFDSQEIVTLADSVASSAIIMYLLGTRRLAFPSSMFYFHEVHATIPLKGDRSNITISDLSYLEECSRMAQEAESSLYEGWLRDLEDAQSWYLAFMADRTGIDTPLFLNLMQNNAVLTAREARDYGIVHEIILR